MTRDLWPKKSNSKSWLSTGLGICSSVFLSELLIFCEWKSEVSNSLMVAILWWATWANRSGHYLKRSNCAKCDLGDSLLGIKRGKTVKNIWKIRIFWANRSFFASPSLESWANNSHCSFLKSDESNLLFCKEQHERIAHGPSLKWAILSERAKSEWAKERMSERAKERMSERANSQPCQMGIVRHCVL